MIQYQKSSPAFRIVEEKEFREVFYEKLESLRGSFSFVTGPGRSGAVAGVYASHFLGVPFVPYKVSIHPHTLIVDTAVLSGRTIRRASKVYDNAPYVYAFEQPPRVKFWYETPTIRRGYKNYFIDKKLSA